jgi:predicted metalloprotease
MRFRDDAQLDTGQVTDRRGMSGPVAIGGVGGVAGLILVIVLTLLNNGTTPNLQIGGAPAGGGNSSDLAASCHTGADANQQEDCRIVAVINSVQQFWSTHLDGYQEANTVFFSESTSTGCGNATTDVGPFYCPTDATVYIDLGFYDELRSRFGAKGGPFAEAYVIAHEYGHHVQDLEGTLSGSQDGTTGPTSSSVRTELQADCYAGVWAKGAVDTKFIVDLTSDDIKDGLDAAASVGDDRIQQAAQGRVNPESFTHGTAEQRQRWFQRGYDGGTRGSCDTFGANNL